MVETRDRQKACSYNRPLVGQAGEGRNLIKWPFTRLHDGKKVVRLTPLNKLLWVLKYNPKQLLTPRKDDSSNELDLPTHGLRPLNSLLDKDMHNLTIFICLFLFSFDFLQQTNSTSSSDEWF